MRAIVITEPGGPEVLQLQDRPAPSPGFGQLRIQVKASAINRADLLQRRGRYPAPPGAPADIPGLEVAGVVESLGAGVRGWSVGDRVMALVPGGGYAQQVVVHAREAMAAPEGLDWAAVGAIPEAFMTAYDAGHVQCGLRAGETILIHAVGSGVGTAAVQLARWAGARSIGTSRTAEKLSRCEALGLDHGVLVKDGQFEEAVAEVAGAAGVDVVLDLIGGGYTPQNLAVLKRQGTLITVGLLAGARSEVPLRTLMVKRLKWRGTVLRARPVEEKIALAQDFAARVVPAFAAGALSPVVDKTFAAEEVVEAHRLMERNATFGKVVLLWDA